MAALNRRVTSLEIKMTRILNLLIKNECASNPCKNGGKCQNIFNGYICNCPSNWEVRNRLSKMACIYIINYLL